MFSLVSKNVCLQTVYKMTVLVLDDLPEREMKFLKDSFLCIVVKVIFTLIRSYVY